MTISTITPQRLYDLVQRGTAIELIDVRTPIEYREIHVTCARNVPLDQLNTTHIVAGRLNTSHPLYVICRSGSRGKQACEKFQAAGFPSVVNVEGGTLAWDQAGLPVVRGKKAISLERQVRITVGLLMVIGTALAYFAHPYWSVVPAMMGIGLAGAGIMDSCLMGMILARMPWNQLPKSTSQPALNRTPERVARTHSGCCG